jgi:hypothetical protein
VVWSSETGALASLPVAREKGGGAGGGARRGGGGVRPKPLSLGSLPPAAACHSLRRPGRARL